MKNSLDKMFENNYMRVPRTLLKIFSLKAGVMLSEIYSEYMYWKERNELQPGGWFFSTVENMYDNTGLSRHQQLTASKELQAWGIIQVKYFEQRRYFKFDILVAKKLYEMYFLEAAEEQAIEYNEHEKYEEEEEEEHEEISKEPVQKKEFKFSF